jgi:coenzyme F420-0:L-glutamate ligase/coenzyme F420-1:gamma-L-glutamate ligase
VGEGERQRAGGWGSEGEGERQRAGEWGSAGELRIIPVHGLPEIAPGDDLAALITSHADLARGDVVVVSSKIVSKAEGAIEHPQPGESLQQARARVIREQSVRMVAESPWVTIVETHHGYVCANAGVDLSNVADGAVLVLPADSDASAATLRAAIRARAKVDVGVVVADTFGRPWRVGLTDVALGVAGVPALRSEIGTTDRHGRTLEATEVAIADELASAADLVRRKAEGVPVVIVRGLDFAPDEAASGQDLIRPPEADLFRHGRGALATTLVDKPAAYAGGVDQRDLWRAQATIELVCGDGVRMRQVRPRQRRAGVELQFSADEPAAAGMAAGVMLALLTDLGYGAVLVEASPVPTVWAGRPASSTANPT